MLLYEPNRQSALSRVQRTSAANDSAADDQHIQRILRIGGSQSG